MTRYILKRLLNYAVLLFIAISLVYLLAGWVLNPYAVYAARQPPVDPAVIEQMMLRYNLSHNVPLLERYGVWLSNIVTSWDWGRSPEGAYVNEQIASRVGVSIRLMLIGTITSIIVGVGIGAWTATRQYKISDRVITFLSLLFVSTPIFVIGLASQVLAVHINRTTGLNIFEFVGETGRTGNYPFAAVFDRLQHLLLPTLALFITSAASFSRIQRNLMLDSLGQDYVRTARAKGLPYSKAVTKHALRTALIPTGTYVAFTVATMFTGATLTETVFSFNGIGRYLVETIGGHDVNGVTAVAAFSGVCVIVGAILSDIVVAVLDPRVRLG
ncbi:MAG: ABC transporter permease [Propionibacteriaceae bacterium]|jgi:peptide/nickel transport system permease protein|nr:ABC transporter permease [Propionibacteriaceae bacterium]